MRPTNAESRGFVPKIIVMDLDGTALDSSSQVRQSTVDVAEYFKALGSKIAIATGRSRQGASEHVKVLNPDICILSGGAYVLCHDEILADFRLHGDMLQFIIDAYKAKGCTQFIVTGTKWSYVSHGVRIIETERRLHSFDEPIDDEYLEISCNYADEELERCILQKDPQLKVIKFKEENWRRYAHRDANKGAALLKVMEKLGISPKEAVAFGDDYNDIDMLRAVEYSVAMANAPDQVKESAKYLCDSNDEDGISRFLFGKFVG